MRAEGGKKEKEKEEKRKEKGGKNGDQNRFLCLFFISPCACFFIGAVVKCIRKTVSKLSRSYPLLFAITILMVSQFGDL